MFRQTKRLEHSRGSQRPSSRALAVAALAALSIALPAAAEAAPFNLDHGGQALVDRINRGVNRQFVPLSPYDDPDGDGVWDCENYAAEKQARLLNAGVDPDAVSVWAVTIPDGRRHAILVLTAVDHRGRRKDLVLDNLSPWAIPRQEVPYTAWAPLALGPGAAVTAVTAAARNR